MKKIRLGVNIDHVATLRNARNENFQNLLDVSKILKELQVDSITVHLREDRRHIKDEDVVALKKKLFTIKSRNGSHKRDERFLFKDSSKIMLYCP